MPHFLSRADIVKKRDDMEFEKTDVPNKIANYFYDRKKAADNLRRKYALKLTQITEDDILYSSDQMLGNISMPVPQAKLNASNNLIDVESLGSIKQLEDFDEKLKSNVKL